MLKKNIFEIIVLSIYELWTIFVLLRILIYMDADLEYFIMLIITKSLHIIGILLYFFSCKNENFSKFVTCFVILTYSLEILPILDSSGDLFGDKIQMFVYFTYGIIHGAGLMSLIYKFKNHFIYAVSSYCLGLIGLIIFFIHNELTEEEDLDLISFVLAIFAFFLLGLIFTYYYSVNEKNLRNLFLSIIYTKNFVNEICKFFDISPINIIISNGMQIQYANNDANHFFENSPGDLKFIKTKLEECIEISLDQKKESLFDFASNTNSINLEKRFEYKKENETIELEGKNNEININGIKSIITTFKVSNNYKAKIEEIRKKYEQLMISSMSHELRTPVNGIYGASEVGSTLTLISNHELNQLFERIKRQCRLLLLLIDNVHDYNLSQNNRLILKKEEIQISNEISNLLTNFEDEILLKRLNANIKIKSEIPNVIINDKDKYLQILFSLLSNSFKYTYSGGVEIRLKYNPNSYFLSTKIVDTGIGIAPEALKNLFVMSTKAVENSSNIAERQGLGLGLTISKILSEKMGGNLFLKSVQGRGTKVTFNILNYNCINSGKKYEIPSLNEIPSEGQRNMKIPQSILNTVRRSGGHECQCPHLLLVDDNESNLFVLKSYSIRKNITFEIAMNGAEALEKVHYSLDHPCDLMCKGFSLILMDINMPIMDGIEATKRINGLCKNYHKNNLTIVAVSANKEEEIKYQSLINGIQEFVLKPLTCPQFERLIHSYH